MTKSWGMQHITTFFAYRHRHALAVLSLLAAVMLGAAASAPFGAVLPTVSEPGGSITRAEVLERAEDWYVRGIRYDQGAEAPDPEGAHDYRTDCSGLVAMAWHLPSTDVNTDSLDRRTVTVRIARDDLLRGDVLDDTDDGHVVIFTGWVSRDASTFTYIHLANANSNMAEGTGSFAAPLLAGHPTANYFALRYNRITDDGTSAALPPARSLDRYPWPAPWKSAIRGVGTPQPLRVGAGRAR